MKALSVFHRRWFLLVLAGLAFVGFLDATYLTAVHYMGEVPVCSVVKGCEVVTTSAYSMVPMPWGTVPISLLGAGYFITLALLLFAVWDSGKRILLKGALWLAAAGFAIALFLFYLQFFVLEAVCQYCLVADTLSIVIFALLAGMVQSRRTLGR
ncbi:MAG: vitamin K epoxide reductase family protein [Candidatus Spechtbacterales bacterium]